MNTQTKQLRDRLLGEINRRQPEFSAIKSVLSSGICLYGYGFVGKWAYDFLKTLGADIKMIIDNDEDKIGLTVNNAQIISSSDFSYGDVNGVVVGSRHAARSILSSLKDISIPAISIDSFVVHYYSDSHLPLVEHLLEEDEQSLRVFYSILLAMLSGEINFLRNNISYCPFFAEYPFFNIDSEVYLDAGAYVGDSFERFVWSVNGMFKRAYLFEPGKKQFQSMCFRIARLSKEWCIQPDKIKCENLAIGDSTGEIKFLDASNPTQSQQILASSSETIDQLRVSLASKTSLDDYFKGLSCLPSIIKVDIEGAELALLDGGERLIAELKPKIALSIYHFPSDIFLLPIKVAKLSQSYRFIMRHHSCMLIETVLYCF